MRRFWAITARILLVAAILLAVRVYSGSSTPQPQFGTGSVIPWTPASPEPAPSPSPKPTPVPTGTPKCRPEDVRAVYWQSGAATGT